MACLLPQFKCQPDSFSIFFRAHHSHHSRHKESICFRAQCVLSTTSPSTLTATTAVLDVEKLRLQFFEGLPKSVVEDRERTFIGTTSPPSEACFETTLRTENRITSDEAVIAAAAAEAVALARAAVKVSKDAALMFKNDSAKIESKSATDSSTSKWAMFTEAEMAGIVGDSLKDDRKLEEDDSAQISTEESDELEPTNEELELLEEQFFGNIAVRSKRQPERKARRMRATEKTAANVDSVKAGPTNKKRHGASQDVIYSEPLRYLKGTTVTSRLLTANEEIELSEGIQDLLKLERLEEELAERFGGPPNFVQWAAAAGVDQKTLRSRLNYGRLCKEKMIKSNIRLVVSIAKNYMGTGMNLQDLVQEGCRGLIRGTEKFDASKGFKFSTYAHWWIKQSVRKFLSEQSRTIRLPFHMVEATYKVKEARKQLYSENGRHPNNKEVAEATGLSMKRLNAVLLTPKAPRSLDQKVGVFQNLKPSEVIADPDADTSEDILTKQLMKKDLEKVLETLSPREKQVIRWRFGMEDGRMKTLQEIGESMGVSRERVRQIESSAFRKLKNRTRSKHLQQYLISYAS